MRFKENEDYFIWSFNHSTNQENLQIATLSACDNCHKPASVNAVWVLENYKFPISEAHAKNQATNFKDYFGITTELSCTEDGGCFCEHCYHQQMKSEEVG
ncbi:hypothetical protein MASR1M48_17100 [Lactococcus petauri]